MFSSIKLAMNRIAGHFGYVVTRKGNVRSACAPPPVADGSNPTLSAAPRFAEEVNRFTHDSDSYFSDVQSLRQENEQLRGMMNIPSILLCTLPKSGSVYIYNLLSKGLGIPFSPVATSLFPEVLIDFDRFYVFNRGRQISQAHIPATPVNLIDLCLSLDRMILHVRDPRNALVSWINFMDYTNKNTDSMAFSAQHLPYIGDHWTRLGNAEKFDVATKYFYRECIDWLSSWFDAIGLDFSGQYAYTGTIPPKDDTNVHVLDSAKYSTTIDRFGACPPRSVKVLLTTHEDMVVSGETSFIRRIMNFYDIPSVLYRKQEIKKDMSTHFRSGRIDGWKKELTTEQQGALTEHLPTAWVNYFGWQ